MDEHALSQQEARKIQQAIEAAKQRRAEAGEKEPVMLGNVSMLTQQASPEQPQRLPKRIGAIADIYPEFLFTSNPQMFSKTPEALDYACPTCGENPGTMKRRNGYKRRPCSCQQTEHERQDRLHFQESVRQDRLSIPARERKTYTWLGMDYSSLAEHSLSNFEMQLQPNAVALVVGYVRRLLARQPDMENVLIYGEKAGLGKTHLAAAILNCAYENGYACLFCTAKDYFDALWASDFKDRLALRQRASKADFLLIDDIDKADAKDPTAQKNEFFQLLNVRYEAGYPTLFTANSSDLSRWFNDWTMSRVQERLLRIPVSGVDYRQVRAERARQAVSIS